MNLEKYELFATSESIR